MRFRLLRRSGDCVNAGVQLCKRTLVWWRRVVRVQIDRAEKRDLCGLALWRGAKGVSALERGIIVGNA